MAVSLAVVGAGAVAVFGLPGVKRPLSGLFASTKSDVITAPVRPGKLSQIIKEKGTLESAANKDVHCEVEGGTSIIKITPEGTRVKEGEVVCELDSASLKDALTAQKISTSQAEASYKQVLLTREVAEYAVKEYKEGIFKQDLSTVEGEIALAKSDQERAIDRLKWSTRMYDKGYVSMAQNIADKLSLERANFELEQAQTKKEVLLKYTKDKTIKELDSEVQKAKADELSKQSTWELEKIKEAKLERQIKACILKAPGDGIVVYANEPGRGGQQQVQIEEGAAVRQQQKIFSLPDTTKMRVNAKIHESMVDRIKPGLRSLVRVEAAANQLIKGQVTSVAPMADPNGSFSSDIKVYTTFVAIEGDTAKLNLRPGMSAQVEILVVELPDVLSVPVQAILQFHNKDSVFIKDGDGFRRVEVALGISNDQHVQVTKGLKPGDSVALTPTTLLTEDERREAFSVAAKDAAKKDFGGDPNAAKGATKGAGAPGDAAPGGEAKAKKKGSRGPRLTPEERAKVLSMPPDEQRSFLQGKGVAPEAVDMMLERMKNGGGGRPGGPGGGGGGGGGFGGPGGPGQ